MIRPKNDTEDFLLSITKNCKMLIEQTHTKPGETLEIKITKPKETFHFNPTVEVKEDWMIGLTDLEFYISIFIITEESKFKLYKIPDEKSGGVSYEKVRDEIESDLDISDITTTVLEDDILGLIVIKEYREQVTERMEDSGYMNFLAGYICSLFQDFESYLRTEVDLVEDDITLFLDKCISSFITHEKQPGIYSFKDLSQSVSNNLQPQNLASSNVSVIEFHDITSKTKLVVRDGIKAIIVDEQPFFATILGFTTPWVYKHYNGYISQKIVNLSTTKKIHLKCDVIDGSVVNGLRHPIFYNFVLDKLPG